MDTCFYLCNLRWLRLRLLFRSNNKWLTTRPQTNNCTFSHLEVGEQCSIPLESSESVHRQSWWRENIFRYEICMVYSAQNMSPLSYSELLSMIRLLWKMHVLLCLRTSAQPNFSSIREKSKHGSSARNNSSSFRCIWFPRKNSRHWIKWRERERRIPLSAWPTSHILKLSLRIHETEPQAAINLQDLGSCVKVCRIDPGNTLINQ